jgi:thymidylate kinase
MGSTSGAIAPLIAIIGCDGSGKSTVSEHLLGWIRRYGPAETAHLGKQSGNVGRALAQLPVVGGTIDRFLNRKAKEVQVRVKADMLPGLLPSLVIIAFTVRRWYRFRRMLAMRRRGLIVVTDRYPQLSIPGAYDGPGFPATNRGGAFIRWLARREFAVFQWMTSHRPDLVLRLNVDLDTACARKPDHRRDALRRKLDVTPRLTYNGAPIVDIDTVQPLDAVLREAEQAIARVMAERGYVITHDKHNAEPA